MLPSPHTPTMGLFQHLPVELRFKIYKLCYRDSRTAVRHAAITNSAGLTRLSPTIVRFTNLAATSRSLRTEIRNEAIDCIHDIRLHEVTVYISALVERDHIPPPAMTSWTGAKHIYLHNIVEPAGENAQQQQGIERDLSLSSYRRQQQDADTSIRFVAELVKSFPSPTAVLFRIKGQQGQRIRRSPTPPLQTERFSKNFYAGIYQFARSLSQIRTDISDKPRLDHAIIIEATLGIDHYTSPEFKARPRATRPRAALKFWSHELDGEVKRDAEELHEVLELILTKKEVVKRMRDWAVQRYIDGMV